MKKKKVKQDIIVRCPDCKGGHRVELPKKAKGSYRRKGKGITKK